MTTTPRKYKKHTLLRRKEAKKKNFVSLDLPGKFKMIKRQTLPAASFVLFQQLSNEEQLLFIRENYKGFKVDWNYQIKQALIFGDKPRIVTTGYSLDVHPKIGKIRYNVTLTRMEMKLSPDLTLQLIRKYLPTVKAL